METEPLDLFAWGIAQPEVRPPVEVPRTAPAIVTPGGDYGLRPYQETMREKTHTHFAKGHRAGLIVAATGAGKSRYFSAMAADWSPARTLVLVDQLDLVDQAVSSLLETAGIYADVEQGKHRAILNAPAVVGMVQSMQNRLGDYPPDHFGGVVCDECDKAVSQSWQRCIGHFPGAKLLGVTATPNRTDKRSILGTFGTKIDEIDTRTLIGMGYLAGITVKQLPLELDLREVDDEDGDYNKHQLGLAIDSIFDGVCDAIKEHAPDRKVLVFCPDVASSKKFAVRCVQKGISAHHIDGQVKNREEIKQGFRDRKFQVLVNPMLLGRGYDDPSIDCIINLRSTKSESFYRQIIGRGTRLYCRHGCRGICDHEDRKKDVLILDVLYQFKGMGPVRPASLIAETTEKRDAMNRMLTRCVGTIDLFELERLATEELQRALVTAMLKAQKTGKGVECFNAFEWAANLRLHDLMYYEPETDTEAEKPHPRLLSKLSKLGIKPASIFCQGHAEKILAIVEKRAEAGLASIKQVYRLREMGFKDADSFTMKRAKSAIYREFMERQKARQKNGWN